MKDSDFNSPALSVILATAGGSSSILTTLRHLQKQTVVVRLELIILAPETSDFGLSSTETACFHDFQLVRLGGIKSVGFANAEGVRRARAPLVVFAEDHAFPEKDWAEALIARHQENWAAVGPVVRNGNPATAVSWADYLLGYGPWHEDSNSGPCTILPGHNSSYKRAVLLKEGDALAAALEAESVLHHRLVRSGERLYLENRAIISHLNFAQPGIFLAVQLQNGRHYAAARRESWPGWKRAFYFLSSPLIPLVRLVRLLSFRVRFPRDPSRLRIVAVLLAALLADGIGQARGYLSGFGSSSEFLIEYEYDRRRFIRGEELAPFERAQSS